MIKLISNYSTALCVREEYIPQGADKAISGALRIQGTYVPDVEETRHLVRHFSPLSGVPVWTERNESIRNETGL